MPVGHRGEDLRARMQPVLRPEEDGSAVHRASLPGTLRRLQGGTLARLRRSAVQQASFRASGGGSVAAGQNGGESNDPSGDRYDPK